MEKKKQPYIFEEELEIICPTCRFGSMDMVGDPEYNDLWECKNCGHHGGSAYGVASGQNK